MPGLRLPIELCELVIDSLDDDHTLRACSLACRAFLRAGRRHLFYHVHLSGRDSAERFLRIICSVPSPTSPCRYIRKLCLTEGWGEALWTNKALPFLAERLSDVTILLFSYLRWSLLDSISRIMILSSFLKVKRLKINYTNFESSEQMNQFIASFPSLVDLDCYQTYWSIDDPLTADLPQSLRTITIESDHSLFFHRLLSRELHPSVRALWFYNMCRVHMKSVGILLKTLGSSLEELDFGDDTAEAVFSNDINLVHNTHLRSLHLTVFHRYVNHLEWVITLLAQITSPYLVHMSLDFQVGDISLLYTIDWTGLENMFNQQRWSNLQELKVCWYGPGPPEIWAAIIPFIRAQFPVLESRGILCV